ncbi:MAG: hypothetical protein AB1813_10685, partial [Verrucomicrobiota bacterium]
MNTKLRTAWLAVCVLLGLSFAGCAKRTLLPPIGTTTLTTNLVLGATSDTNLNEWQKTWHGTVNKAIVRAVRGKVVFQAGTRWQPCRVGHELPPGVVLRTGPKAQIDFFLGDNGPIIRLLEASQLEIKTLLINRAGVEPVIFTKLHLIQGGVMGNVKKLADSSRYYVETPRGPRQIFGGEYRIDSAGVVSVISGTCIAYDKSPKGKENYYTIQAGQSLSPSSETAEAQIVATVSLPGYHSTLASSAADISAVTMIYNTVSPPTAPPPP